jgi:hypothetical protein
MKWNLALTGLLFATATAAPPVPGMTTITIDTGSPFPWEIRQACTP